MDGMHDLGGKQGFAPIVKEGNTSAFKEDWEVRVNALVGRLVGKHVFNMDEYRHAIERMAPQHYLTASYFERVYMSVATLCVEKCVFTKEELEQIEGREIVLSNPSAPGRSHDAPLPELAIGDVVRVRELFIPGHIRMPAYVRGKVGRIVGKSPAYPFPDASGHGLESPRQVTFDVCFKSSDLWPNGSEEAEVNVGLFHAYLEKVQA
jgi:nitrile hydratase